MAESVKLSNLESVLDDLEYPTTPSEIRRDRGDVTIQLADGTENLGDLIGNSSAESFDSPDELANEVMNLLPRHAVGEPYQSEGEG